MISKTAGIAGPVSNRLDAAAALGIPIVGEYRCTGTVSFLTVDNLIVPPGRTCTLTNSRIMGSIKVEDGASLNASGLYVKGSLQTKKAASVIIVEVMIDGSMQVEEGKSAQLRTSLIGGSVLFIKNTGSLTILNNIIHGNLQCKENKYKPTGAGNIVFGNKEDQCSGL